MKRKRREPSAAAGIFSVVGGTVCLIGAVHVLLTHGQGFRAAAIGSTGIPWGLAELARAKRWRHEPEDAHYATTPKEIRESESDEKLQKSGSMQNVLFLLGIFIAIVAVAATAAAGYMILSAHGH
jgi:uncharacterized membrane protein